ncbi:MAG: hypothetical protein MJZ72_01495 [Bacteroidales bacterium]|nr:hypothetical protein [Bacteroidales bacterium]
MIYYTRLIYAESKDLLIAHHIVNQTCPDVSGGISCKTYAAAEHPVHTLLAIAVHVFNPHPRRGVFPVERLLPFAELLSLDFAFDHAVLHPETAHQILYTPANVGAVGEPPRNCRL